MKNIKLEYQMAIDELTAVMNLLDETQLEEAAAKIAGAKNLFFSAQGRSGNMARALSIRFMHMGISSYVAGEPSTPSIGKGDVLIAISGSGKTAITLSHIATAKKVGAESILLCSQKENPTESDLFICVPAKSQVPSGQHAGSLFEQSVLLLGDAISRAVQEMVGATTESMNARHANLQ